MSIDALKFAAQDADHFFERHAEIALLGMSLVIGPFGVGDMFFYLQSQLKPAPTTR